MSTTDSTTDSPDLSAISAERDRIRAAHLTPTGERPATTAIVALSR